MKSRCVRDWTLLPGACVEIRVQGQLVGAGCVDSVTDDGGILWLVGPAQTRKLYEKTERYEAWVVDPAASPAGNSGLAGGRSPDKE